MPEFNHHPLDSETPVVITTEKFSVEEKNGRYEITVGKITCNGNYEQDKFVAELMRKHLGRDATIKEIRKMKILFKENGKLIWGNCYEKTLFTSGEFEGDILFNDPDTIIRNFMKKGGSLRF